jgi:pimeloyl-ACP methyl ester carboxylesterase
MKLKESLRTLVFSLRLLGVAAGCALSLATAAAAAQGTTFKPGEVMAAEAQSKSLCESVPTRVFIETKLGSECIAYYVTNGFETRAEAVLYFSGDAPPLPSERAFKVFMFKNLGGMRNMLQGWAGRMRVRYVYVARSGLQGSSGDHSARNNPKETYVMSAAAVAIKQRLALNRIAVVGQSRGSTLAASMLTLNQADVTCAVLGSGALELLDLEYARAQKENPRLNRAALGRGIYDPAGHIGTITQNPARRVFVLGDPTDTRTPLPQQFQFADAIKAAGHHAVAVEVKGDGDGHHGVSKWTLPVAGACLNNLTDDLITGAVARGQTWAQQIRAMSELPHKVGRWKPATARPIGAATASGAPKS